MEAAPATAFNISARQYFLTYPKCEMPKQRLSEALHTLLPVEYLLIAQETHEDGSPHLHAFVRCTKKVGFRNQNKLDVDGYHPNIQAAKSIAASVKYL
jgi:hypothetical protein